MTDTQRLTTSPVAPATAAEFIRGRRSSDQFEATVPDPARLREAFEMGCWAPNHHLTEPWHFYAIGAETKAAIIELNTGLVAQTKDAETAEAKRSRWQAVPGWFAITCRRADDPTTADENYAACACAAQNIALYLHSAGLACKWTSGAVTRHPAYLSLLGADPASEYSIGLFWYGTPKRAPRSQRSNLDACVTACP